MFCIDCSNEVLVPTNLVICCWYFDISFEYNYNCSIILYFRENDILNLSKLSFLYGKTINKKKSKII